MMIMALITNNNSYIYIDGGLVTKLCLDRCDLPGSSVHGILQASIHEWVAIPFCRASS